MKKNMFMVLCFGLLAFGAFADRASYTNDIAAISALAGPTEKLAAAERILAYTNSAQAVIIKAVNLGKLGRHAEALALLPDGTTAKAAAYNRAGDYENAKKEARKAFKDASGMEAIRALQTLTGKRAGANKAEINDLVIEAFTMKGNIKPTKKDGAKNSGRLKKQFLSVDRSLMTSPEYAEFCRSVLKNVELTEDTRAFLSFVRGEYESVK
ncbi:MAG: hypothetical protein K9M45_01630 [Kiritimatiellales bacterium]|nr:hypothetical protein [Kiritimatiellales bacterium]